MTTGTRIIRSGCLLFMAALWVGDPRAAGQTLFVNGRVHDAKSGLPLPAANVQVIGTVSGTITNSDGGFRLQVTPPARLRVSYIGYNSQSFAVEAADVDSLDIRLVPAVIDMGQLTITARNPAYAIMEKVFARKRAMQEKIRTFSARAYHRLNVRNDSSVVVIVENVSRLYWQAGRGSREVFGELKQTTNLPTLRQGIGVSDIPNFYDDDIPVGGYTFVGPTHPQAFDFYNFSLSGRHAMDGRIIYEIHIAPKGRLQPLFEGEIAIQDSTFALIAVELAGSGMARQMILQRYQVHLEQQFREISPGIWLPADWHEQGTLNVGMTGLQFPAIHYRRLASLDDHQLNVPVPDSLFRLERYESPRDTALLFTERGVPLSFEENWAYEHIDSSMTLLKAFKPTGFIARMAKLDVRANDQSLTESDTTGGEKGGSGAGGRFLLLHKPAVWFNRVDALHLGWNSSLSRGAWKLNGGAAYNTGPGRWGWQAGLAHTGSRGGLEAAWSDETRPLAAAENYPLLFNSVPLLLGYRDYYDYYRARGWRGSLMLNSRKQHLAGKLSLLREIHDSVIKTSDFDLVRRKEPQRANPAISAGTVAALAVRLDWGQAEPDLFSGAKGIRLEYERGLEDFIGGEYGYSLFRLRAGTRLETFLRRQMVPAALDLHLIAGAATANAPVQRLAGLPGALGLWSPFGSFHTLRGGSLYGEKYAGLFWEHSFRAWPFDALGWRYPGEKGVGLLLHGAHGRIWGDASADKLDLHELGISLSGLFSYVRVDVTRRLGTPGFWCTGLSVAKFF